ncbi:MAG TPA: pilin [Candidatus Paceibacterota bacterium]|nr:pilin [Candidatus Paceibacterota bacterium]
MKKLLLALLLCLPLALSLPTAVFAVGPNGTCSNDEECDDQGNIQYGCYKTPGNTTGICTPWGDAPGGGGGTQTPGGNTQVGDNQPFVPLTDIPVFTSFNPSAGLPVALNSIYYICIGIAVVIAVLQLARAGITYMLAESLTSKEEARHLIGASVLGLVLVLSPYLVFKLINPAILTLNINTSGLTVNVNGSNSGYQSAGPGAGSNNDGTSGAQNGDDGHQYLRCNQDSCEPQKNTCEAGGGTASYVCRDQQTGEYTPVNPPYKCAEGSYNYIDCYKGTKGDQWYYDGGYNFYMCDESTSDQGVWGTCSASDQKCTTNTPPGTVYDHICRDRKTKNIKSAVHAGGQFGCDLQNDLYTQCKP